MYCKHCGSEMPNDAIFCSHCGTRLAPEEELQQSTVQEQEPLPAAAEVRPAAPAGGKPAEEPPRKPFLEEMQWNVSEYPDSNVIEKTEDIDFNWGTDPDTVPEHMPQMAMPKPQPKQPAGSVKSPEGIRVSEIFDRVVPTEKARESVAPAPERKPEPMPEPTQGETEGSGLGKFNTVKQKNAEFQQLLDKEYEKIKVAGTIGREQNQADAIASERFDSRQETMTMDQFLQQEGAVKLYEPKPLESDVLARIEAQEKRRARQKAEAEARAKALEEARAEAAAAKQAEIDRLNNEAEASAAAAEEIRLAEEEEIRRRTEAEAKRKAEAEAARLEAIANRKAAQERAALQEQERRAAAEARARVEAEEKARAQAQAQARAEAEAARAAEEAARQKAEAELNAAREAARIRAQQEANAAALEEARFRAEQERRAREEQMLRQRQTMRARQQEQAKAAVMETQVRDALAQTAKMREEEEAKIKAALAGIRGGRFTDIISSGAEAAEAPAEAPAPESYTQPAPPAQAAPAADEILDALNGSNAPAELNPAVSAAAAFFGQEIPAAPAAAAAPAETPAAETVATAPEQIEEAHQATRSQIDEMARARANFFADFPDAEEIRARAEAPAGLGQTRMVSKEDLLTEIDNTKVLSRDELHLEDVVEEEEVLQAEKKEMQGQLNEMDDLLTQFASVSMPAEEVQPAVQPVQNAADLPEFNEPQERFAAEPPVMEAPAFGGEPQAFAEEAPAYAEEAPVYTEEVRGFEETAPAAFEETVQALPDEEAPAFAGAEQQMQPEMAQEMPAAAAAAAGVEKPGLEDTMIMPMAKETIASAREEAAGRASNEWQQMGNDRVVSAAGRYAEEEQYYDEPKKKGGVGRTILMIILILLCVVFALELAGIGIKLLAPTSGAAEFIDNILNSLIHMITG